MTETGNKPTLQRLKWLEGEVAAWQRDGIIDEGQAGAILQRYAARREREEAVRGGRLVTVLAVIGAILLGLGVILFFASNWQAMSKTLKVAIVLGSIVIAYAIGYFLAFEKQNYPRVGRAVILLGSILYGAGIWLIAQIFHISSHYPNGVLMWAVGIIPLVIICGSLSVLIEASLLLTFWTVLEQAGFQNYNWLYLPLFALALWLGYRLKSRLAVGLTLPGLVIWTAVTNAVAYKYGQGIMYGFFLTALLGLLIYTAGNLQAFKEEVRRMKLPYQITGLLVFLLSFYILSFKVLRLALYEREMLFTPFFVAAYIIVALGVAAAGAVAVLKGRGDRGRMRDAVFVLAAAALTVILTFTVPVMGGKVFLAVINVLLFITVVTLIVLGYANREPVLVNFGLVFFVLDIIARYFDFFWEMMDKSIFFMAGGLLLLVGGSLLERYRRKIMREMQVKNYAA